MSERPELCVGAVAMRDGELLLIERGRGVAVGQWSIPGGRVEFGETMADALRREVAEETGLQVVVGPVIGWAERPSPEHHFVIVDFAVDVVGGALRAGDDAAGVRWVRFDELANLPLVDGLLAFLHEHSLLPAVTD